MTFPSPDPAGVRRRTVLLGAPAAAALIAWSTPTAAGAADDDYLAQAFKALAAYVVPGSDEYSKQQRLTTQRPGGVAAGTDVMLEETYDKAIAVGIAPLFEVNLPGAAGVALLLDVFTRVRYPEQPSGPFQHPFANLGHSQKALVLADLDTEQLLEDSPIGYAFGTIITLTAFGCYGERGVYNPQTRVLRGRPVGWDLAQYDGVSDGWPELRGYWGGRTSVPDVPVLLDRAATDGQGQHA
ncbi:MAG TPA: hypothetical protein VLL08_11045 [Kineosporiaceae bacterium]|nr:hypothetical protein [Kineosporiaceae bacterium]